MNILHILATSLPFVSGFTLRSKYIFKYQKKFAKIFVFTTFVFKTDKNMEIIEGIPYFRMNQKLSYFLRFYRKWYERTKNIVFKLFSVNITNGITELPLSFFSKYYIKKLLKLYKIDLIHQHSQSFIGKYSLEVAKKLNIPYIYEARGFVEKSMLATTKGWKNQDKKIIKFVYNELKTRENNILIKADFITTLSKPMKDILVKRKIDKEKIIVVPNSIDTTMIKSIEKNYNLKRKLLLGNSFIIGHFGRLRWYEGIEILLEALRILLDYKKDVKLVIIGNSDEDYLEYLKTEIREKNLQNNVLFLGYIFHKEIGDYFSIVDIIVIPRINASVCRIVTPLKPIDAMAFRTLVIASDLPALRYTITPYETGVLFKPEDPKDLVNKILEYLLEPDSYQKIIDNAYKNVLKNFTWESVVPRYKKVYETLIIKK